MQIIPWREVLAKQPAPGECTLEEEVKRMKELWTSKEQELFDSLKQFILSGPPLARPDPNRLFVLKTDWCRLGMGFALCQPDSSPESIAEEQRIAKISQDGTLHTKLPKSNFDRTINGLRLRPVMFGSRRCTTKAETSAHSYVGEAATVRWAIRKCHRYLMGTEFLLLGDCSGLSKFFDPQPGDEISPNHQLSRWRAELLCYNFRFEHRPARMMTECDALSRYNRQWEEYTRLYGHEQQQFPNANELAAATTATAIPLPPPSTSIVPVNLGLISPTNSSTEVDYLYSWRDMTGYDESDFFQAQAETRSAVIGTPLVSSEPSSHRGISNAPAWFSQRNHMSRIPPWNNKPMESVVPLSTINLQMLKIEEDTSLKPTFPLQVLPPVCFVGEATTKNARRTPEYIACKQRSLLLVDALGAPISEAFNAVGLAATNIIRLEHERKGLAEELNADFPSVLPSDWMQHVSDNPTPPLLLDWMIAVYPYSKPLNIGSPSKQLQDWLAKVASIAEFAVKTCDLQAVVLMCPEFRPIVSKRLTQLSFMTSDWKLISSSISNASHGGWIDSKHQVFTLLPSIVTSKFTFPSTPSTEWTPQLLEVMDTVYDVSDALLMKDLQATMPLATPVDKAVMHTNGAEVVRFVSPRLAPSSQRGEPAYSSKHPGPALQDVKPDSPLFHGTFGIWIGNKTPGPACCRPIRDHELLRGLGIGPNRAVALLNTERETWLPRVRTLPGRQAFEAISFALYTAEVNAINNVDKAMINTYLGEVNPAITLPLPTENEWKEAVALDHDCQVLIRHLQAKSDKIPVGELHDRRYADAYDKDRLSYENGILYHFDLPYSSRTRQLKVKVVPKKLQHVVMAACHTSPFAGHSGIQRTTHRVIARFWWPSVRRDIENLVRACLYCRFGNNTSHETMEILHELESTNPWDAVFLDFWDPGDIPDCTKGDQKLLTYCDELTGACIPQFLGKGITTQRLLQAAFQVFLQVGIPHVIYVDADNKFAGFFKQVFTQMLIPVVAVSRENHKAVRNERFHRYLNKVETINTADTGSLHKWVQGVFFAIYAWNADAVDGTDIPRCIPAFGREFPFPIDIKPLTSAEQSTVGGQQLLEYMNSTFPFMLKQREIFSTLVTERRRRHREYKNEGKRARVFSPGDIVLVRKRVQSSTKDGISAKLVFRARGPYRVLEQADSPSSYIIQRIPFTRGLGRPGRRVKEKAARMERIPSVVVFPKLVDGADTRFASMNGPLVSNPLERWIRVTERGKYVKADQDENYAFEKVASIWDDEVEEPSSDEDSENEEDQDDTLDDQDESTLETTLRELPQSAWFRDVETRDGEQGEEQASTLDDPLTLEELAELEAANYPPKQVSRLQKKALQNLSRAIDESSDRLFFIRYKENDAATETWRLVQAEPTRSYGVAMRDYGVYRCRFWDKHLREAEDHPTRNCRYWPEIRKVTNAGALDKRQAVSPDTNTPISPAKPRTLRLA